MDELKPCPFCGSKDVDCRAWTFGSDCYVKCTNCGATIETVVPWEDMSEEKHDEACREVLIELWTRRDNYDTNGAVPVVRCKDCIWYAEKETGEGWCSEVMARPMPHNGFCSYGEKEG